MKRYAEMFYFTLGFKFQSLLVRFATLELSRNFFGLSVHQIKIEIIHAADLMLQKGKHYHGHRSPPIRITDKNIIVLVYTVRKTFYLRTGVRMQFVFGFFRTGKIIFTVRFYGFDFEQIAADDFSNSATISVSPFGKFLTLPFQ